MTSKEQHTAFIKEEAYRLGFQFCGISRAGFLELEATRLEQWLQDAKHGEMGYMENYFDKRLDPRLLVDGAKSVITVLLNYYPTATISTENNYKISKYAYGTDYHYVIKEKLNALLAAIQEEIGEVNGRAFVDSAPVMDKAWAARSGAGWQGKNGNLIRPKVGSFFFIAELIVDLDLCADSPIKDYCGTCTKCVDACPTGALDTPYVVDGSKCISYLTIELKNNIPESFKTQMQDWIFGCDICQDVCPWNRFSIPNQVADFDLLESVKTMQKQDWQEMTKEVFNSTFKNSSIKRTKWEGIQKNIQFIEG